MKKITYPLLFSFIGLVAQNSHADDCDCQQKVGRCTGAVEVIKKFGSSPSYGAEIGVHSSEKQCSKVEYYVDNTPYQTILKNKNSDIETVFGTKPISENSVKYSNCYVCYSNATKEKDPKDKNKESSPFAGRWVATDRNIMGFKHTTTYNVTVNGDSLSGSYYGNGGSGSLTGTISGNTATINCTNCFPITWNLIDSNTIKYSYKFGSGTLKKEQK